MKNNIKKRRKAIGYTQEDLAYICNTTRETIHRIETGKHIPNSILIAHIEFALYRNIIRSLELDGVILEDLIDRMNDIYIKYHPEECL